LFKYEARSLSIGQTPNQSPSLQKACQKPDREGGFHEESRLRFAEVGLPDGRASDPV
jgi:hypothetical protein